MLVELKACFMEAYDDNQDGKIDIREVSPPEESPRFKRVVAAGPAAADGRELPAALPLRQPAGIQRGVHEGNLRRVALGV